MSDTDTSPAQPGRTGSAPTATGHGRGLRRGWSTDLLRPLWTLKQRIRTGTEGPSRLGPSKGRAGSGMWMLIVVGILLCLPIAGVVLGYIARPPAGTASISADGSSLQASPDNAGKIPKPAPGRPMGSSHTPPPTITTPTAAPIEPTSPPQIAVPQKPISPMSTPAPPPAPAAPPPVPASGRPTFAAVTYPARHDKHFGGECTGQLTLNSTELVFSCPEDAGSGFQVAINEIDSVDDNGIRLLSGKKYHFTISGMNKGAERALFTDWLRRVR